MIPGILKSEPRLKRTQLNEILSVFNLGLGKVRKQTPHLLIFAVRILSRAEHSCNADIEINV